MTVLILGNDLINKLQDIMQQEDTSLEEALEKAIDRSTEQHFPKNQDLKALVDKPIGALIYSAYSYQGFVSNRRGKNQNNVISDELRRHLDLNA